MNGSTRLWLNLLAVALSCVLALHAPRAEALLVCPLRDIPGYAPAHPGPNDRIGVYAIMYVASFDYLLDQRVVSRVVTLADGTPQVDAVITHRPDLFPGYHELANAFDEPLARLGPMAPGGHLVSVSVRMGDDPASLGPICDSVAWLQVVVAETPGATETAPVIEYYDAALDHYFITQDAAEISDLDSGVHPGWRRTGQIFLAYRAGRSDGRGAPVARFYGLPSHGLDTHFFTATWAEQRAFAARAYFSDWQAESSDVFELPLPDLATGTCAPGTHPVYRLWNQRIDSNHRYTTDAEIRAAMIATGWTAEGYGPDAVALCAL